ncbi:MAG: hypothetical protein ABI823_05835 [Bryobacteraceae bacterium]
MESAGQRASNLLHELEEELAAKDREIASLKAQLTERASPVPPGLTELLDAQQAQLERSRRLLYAIENFSAQPPVSGNTPDEEVLQLRAQLRDERVAHEEQVGRLIGELETARECASSLEGALLELRGALQRIEAKFNLYAAAVLKLSEVPEPKRPKLLSPSKQLPGKKVNGFSIR